MQLLLCLPGNSRAEIASARRPSKTPCTLSCLQDESPAGTPGRDPVKWFRRPGGRETIWPVGGSRFLLPAKPRRNESRISKRSRSNKRFKKYPLICTHRKEGGCNETAFTRGCNCSVGLCSAFCSDQVDASNAAVRCRRGGMEMQQVGVGADDLLAQPHPPS